MLRRIAADLRSRFSVALGNYQPSAFLFALVMMLGLVLILSSAILASYLQKDVAASLSFVRADGWCDEGGIGVHCFGDYGFTVLYAEQADPWSGLGGFLFPYPAAGLFPHRIFAGIGDFVGNPEVGLFLYLALLAVAVTIPAFWASRGKSLALRVITIGAFGIASVPALGVLDRGNSAALVVPALLLFLIALRRDNYSLAVSAVVLAAMVKPHYAMLVLVFFVMRKWRHGLAAIAAVVLTNTLAYLAWPSRFPITIWESIRATISHGTGVSASDSYPANISFAKAFYLVEYFVKHALGLPTQDSWTSDHASLLSSVFVAAVLVSLLVLGRRVPGHLVGIVAIVCASMFPSVSWSYYLVFALPVAAVVLRDPQFETPHRYVWRGVFDESLSRPRTIAIALMQVALALTIMRIILPIALVGGPVDAIVTSTEWVPVLWILALVAIVVGWALPARNATLRLPTEATPEPDERELLTTRIRE